MGSKAAQIKICDSNGYQIARGILGNADQAGKADFLARVENIYGFIMFGVFLLALLGLMITFFYKESSSFYYGFILRILKVIN